MFSKFQHFLKKLLNLEEYTSSLDHFLADFDRTHPHLTASQRKENEKYQRIFHLRDKPIISNKHPGFWEKF